MAPSIFPRCARLSKPKASRAIRRSRSFPMTGGRSRWMRCCAPASNAIGRWCKCLELAHDILDEAPRGRAEIAVFPRDEFDGVCCLEAPDRDHGDRSPCSLFPDRTVRKQRDAVAGLDESLVGGEAVDRRKGDIENLMGRE